jgi:hypothetical protein
MKKMILFIGFLGALAANDIVAMNRFQRLVPKVGPKQVRNLHWGKSNPDWIQKEEAALDVREPLVAAAELRHKEIIKVIAGIEEQQAELAKEYDYTCKAQESHPGYEKLERQSNVSMEDIPCLLRRLEVKKMKLKNAYDTLGNEKETLRDEVKALKNKKFIQ